MNIPKNPRHHGALRKRNSISTIDYNNNQNEKNNFSNRLKTSQIDEQIKKKNLNAVPSKNLHARGLITGAPEMRGKPQTLPNKRGGGGGGGGGVGMRGRLTKSQSNLLSTTNNAMKGAMNVSRRSRSTGRKPAEEGGHVMGGGRTTTGGEEPRRKPRSLPPLTQKPKSPVIAASPLDHELGSSRFIGSPPPTALRSHEGIRDDNGNALAAGAGSGGRRSSGSEGGEEGERTVYKPSNPALEMSQPRITLNTAPRNASPPMPAHAIVAADTAAALVVSSGSSLSLRSLASMASESLSLSQALTPPPKLVSYRAEGGAEAVQEWVPDDTGEGLATPPRKNSSPSIRDLPSPMMGRHALSRPPPPPNARRTRSTVKLSPIHKES